MRAMYCAPSMAKVIGGPMPLCNPVGSSRSMSPLSADQAIRRPFRRDLEHKIGRGAQRAAKPAVAHRYTPADFLPDRVIRDQAY